MASWRLILALVESEELVVLRRDLCSRPFLLDLNTALAEHAKERYGHGVGYELEMWRGSNRDCIFENPRMRELFHLRLKDTLFAFYFDTLVQRAIERHGLPHFDDACPKGLGGVS